jgi:hypothetical protein
MQCSELIVFYEKFVEFDAKVNGNDSKTVQGILSGIQPSRTLSNIKWIEPTMVPLVYLIYTLSIIPNSIHEINLDHSLRRNIENNLRAGSGKKIPTTVFDEAFKEVLSLLYSNAFKSIVAINKQKG